LFCHSTLEKNVWVKLLWGIVEERNISLSSITDFLNMFRIDGRPRPDSDKVGITGRFTIRAGKSRAVTVFI